MALVTGAHGEAAEYLEDAARWSVRAGRPGRAAADLGGAAFEAVLAGDSHTAKRLAESGLSLARQAPSPMARTLNLNALAGALIDDDPERAKNLLRESLEIRAGALYAGADLTQGVFLWASLGEWSETLELAAQAIRSVEWSTMWFNLVAISNIVARALAEFDAEAAAVLQGIARHFATYYVGAAEPPTMSRAVGDSESPGAAPAHAAGLIVRLRRDTTRLLVEGLGDERLHELRSQGEAMDNTEAIAYALDAIARARADLEAATDA
jgi:hypothetical protein